MNTQDEQTLIELLVKDGHILPADAENVFKLKKVHDASIRETLVREHLATEDQILSSLSKEFHVPVAELKNFQPDLRLTGKVSLLQASSFGIFPLREEQGEVVLGVVDIFNSHIYNDLQFSFSFSFKLELLSEESLKSLIQLSYENSSDDGFNTQELEIITKDLNDSENDEIDPAVNDAPVVKLLNNILNQAIKDHASDIHFEPFEEEFKIRYRIDGTLYEMIPPPRHLALSVLSRIKVMARLNIAEKRLPQDGRIRINFSQKSIDLRVSTLPTAFGESAVLRVLDRSHLKLQLENLGLNQNHLRSIRDIIQKPNGIFITTGPTGAGKTTTLYSCLREINTIDTKIITTEDPVEYDIEGITQVQIHEAIGLSFAASLRSILRQDPDKIMVGEIRDLETMNMAIQASLTGHLVLSTLHTNDAPSAITRLIDMGVEPFLICSSLEGILAQRLVRKICQNCKEAFTPGEHMLNIIPRKFFTSSTPTFYMGKGCEECSGIGYKGQTGIYELLTLNNEIRDLIMKRTTARMIKDIARKHGMVTLMEDGIKKIESGLTTIEEVASCAIEG